MTSRCDGAGQVAQINTLTLQLQALLESGGHPSSLEGLPTSGLSRLQSFPALALEQSHPQAGGVMQLEAPESLRGFLLEPGRQSSDDLAIPAANADPATPGDAADAAMPDELRPRPGALEDIAEEGPEDDQRRLQCSQYSPSGQRNLLS